MGEEFCSSKKELRTEGYWYSTVGMSCGQKHEEVESRFGVIWYVMGFPASYAQVII